MGNTHSVVQWRVYPKDHDSYLKKIKVTQVRLGNILGAFDRP